MIEKDLYDLIKQSTKSPSKDFTDSLMTKIILQKENEYSLKWRIGFLYILCFIIFIFISSFVITIPEIRFIKYAISFSPTSVKILSISFILFEIYQLYVLRQNLQRLENNGA